MLSSNPSPPHPFTLLVLFSSFFLSFLNSSSFSFLTNQWSTFFSFFSFPFFSLPSVLQLFPPFFPSLSPSHYFKSFRLFSTSSLLHRLFDRSPSFIFFLSRIFPLLLFPSLFSSFFLVWKSIERKSWILIDEITSSFPINWLIE